jgi:hypothetical protein
MLIKGYLCIFSYSINTTEKKRKFNQFNRIGEASKIWRAVLRENGVSTCHGTFCSVWFLQFLDGAMARPPRIQKGGDYKKPPLSSSRVCPRTTWRIGGGSKRFFKERHELSHTHLRGVR